MRSCARRDRERTSFLLTNANRAARRAKEMCRGLAVGLERLPSMEGKGRNDVRIYSPTGAPVRPRNEPKRRGGGGASGSSEIRGGKRPASRRWQQIRIAFAYGDLAAKRCARGVQAQRRIQQEGASDEVLRCSRRRANSAFYARDGAEQSDLSACLRWYGADDVHKVQGIILAQTAHSMGPAPGPGSSRPPANRAIAQVSSRARRDLDRPARLE